MMNEWKYLVMLSLGCHLLPAFLLALLFRPGLILYKVLFRKGSLIFELSQCFLSLLLPVLVFVTDGVCVHCRLNEIRKRFVLQFRHPGQAKKCKAMCQAAKIQI